MVFNLSTKVFLLFHAKKLILAIGELLFAKNATSY